MFTIGIYTSLNPSSKRKSGDIINHTLVKIDKKAENNLYLETLIGNSYIEGNNKNTGIQTIRNSDRNLLVSSGNDANENYLKFNEDTDRNVLQKYSSNIDLTLPNDTVFDLIYIKNLL